ncbi:hypothetical protein CHS0354_016165 [Potamilus streckersoni]|uniref:Uncharacterized protein n=1 Tax=Potamilus streckersoni TaxID=2493646 RepID=A0AAE0RXC6_9BIVA|nr:hypothetical protein CHS0354_016165 [Potamilus streckersoni]
MYTNLHRDDSCYWDQDREEYELGVDEDPLLKRSEAQKKLSGRKDWIASSLAALELGFSEMRKTYRNKLFHVDDIDLN